MESKHNGRLVSCPSGAVPAPADFSVKCEGLGTLNPPSVCSQLKFFLLESPSKMENIIILSFERQRTYFPLFKKLLVNQTRSDDVQSKCTNTGHSSSLEVSALLSPCLT